MPLLPEGSNLGVRMPEKLARERRAKGTESAHRSVIGGTPLGAVPDPSLVGGGATPSRYSPRADRQARIFRTKNASARRVGALHSMPRSRSSDQNASSLNHCRLA
jgi:hypothetical protein